MKTTALLLALAVPGVVAVTGAAPPIIAYPGVSAITSEPKHISATDAVIAARRPARSA